MKVGRILLLCIVIVGIAASVSGLLWEGRGGALESSAFWAAFRSILMVVYLPMLAVIVPFYFGAKQKSSAPLKPLDVGALALAMFLVFVWSACPILALMRSDNIVEALSALDGMRFLQSFVLAAITFFFTRQ